MAHGAGTTLLLPPAYGVRREGYVLTRVCPSICLSTGGGGVRSSRGGQPPGGGQAPGGSATGGVSHPRGGQVQLPGGGQPPGGSTTGGGQPPGGGSGPAAGGGVSHWGGQPAGGGQPRQDNIGSTCYMAGGMSLAFTQEDFLVTARVRSTTGR